MYERYYLDNRVLALFALLAFVLIAIAFLGTRPTKYALGFYRIRPLSWWGRGESFYLLLWNAEQTEAHVQIGGDINCSTSVPPIAFAYVVCSVPRAAPGEHRILKVCLTWEELSECGELSLVFD